MLVFDLSGSRKYLPDGFAFSRASEIYVPSRDRAVFVKSAADTPVFIENYGLKLNPPSTNLISRSFIDGSGTEWTGMTDFKFVSDNRIRPVLIDRKTRYRLHNEGSNSLPRMNYSYTYTNPSPVTITAIVEPLDAESFVIGVINGSTWVARFEFDLSDGSITSSSGDYWYGRATSLGSGSNALLIGKSSTKVWIFEIRGYHTGYDVCVAPTGEYQNYLSVILHHLQMEEHRGFTSPIYTSGSSSSVSGDTISSSFSGSLVPVTFAVDAVTSNFSGNEQVLWQMDDNSESNVIKLIRDTDTSIRLQTIISNTLTDDVQIVSTTNELYSFGFAFSVDSSNALNWSLNGGTVNTGTLTMPSSLSNERIGGDTLGGNVWSGYIWRMRRWNEVRTDLTTLSTSDLNYSGLSSIIVPSSAIG